MTASGWDLPQLRRYESQECDPDGYPFAWSQPSMLLGQPAFVTAPARDESVIEWTMKQDVAMCPPIKDMIRQLTGHRCIRCGHPYVVGESKVWEEPTEPDTTDEVVALALWEHEPVDVPVKTPRPTLWSACDERCTHPGPVRWRRGDGDWNHADRWTAGDWAHVRSWDAEVQAAWRVMTVHHATGEKADCRWWNLLALCQRCHLSVQKRVQMDRVWVHEHSDWFKPYVAGFYAQRYEGRDITRAEAEARMDELLAYERVA